MAKKGKKKDLTLGSSINQRIEIMGWWSQHIQDK
ncbi:MAG: hypothetical protein ACJAZP_002778 [Psychromonas sp.]|jgi:hypothetical protein